MLGLDVLGMAKFADLAIREWPFGWSCGVFANTFGNVWPALEKLLATGRCPRVRIHAVWQDDHRYKPRRDDPVIMRELGRATALQIKFPNVEVTFSFFCEHNIVGNELYALLAAIKRNNHQNLLIVNSVFQGEIIHQRGVINEVHGDHRKPSGPYNWSYDGLNCVDSDVEKFKRDYGDAETCFYWHPAFNGKLKLDDSTPRPLRKSWPTPELIDSIIYLHRECGNVKLARDFLWKSHADRHNTPPEPRAYKPVLIAPKRVKRFELVASNGQVVHVSSGPQPFADGRFRYYFDSFGYQISEKAKRIQGSAVLTLRGEGKNYGSLNPAYRCGGFR